METQEIKYNHFIDFMAELILKYQKQLLESNKNDKEDNNNVVKENADGD
jgi:hypothetical protein